MTIRPFIASACLLLGLVAAPVGSQAAQCNDACPSIIRTGTLPTFIPGIFVGSNTWFDPAFNGHGWTFSELVGPLGGAPIGLGVTYTYETNGQPTWLLLQGSWQRETSVRRLLEGAPVAVLTGPIFDGQGGACPTCPYTAPTIAQRRYQNARVTFLRPDVATVELDGQIALSGPGKLVPSELVLTRPLPTVLAGRWRFTSRLQAPGTATYEERNFNDHGCELTITAVPSPTTENRFDADPAGAPFWLPPSGANVQWFSISSTNCTREQDAGLRLHLAVVPGSAAPLRAIALSPPGTVATIVPGSLGVVASYNIQRTSRFMEFFVQGPDKLIARYHPSNDPARVATTSLNFVQELELTRAP